MERVNGKEKLCNCNRSQKEKKKIKQIIRFKT